MFMQRGIVNAPKGHPGVADTLDRRSPDLWAQCPYDQLMCRVGGRAYDWDGQTYRSAFTLQDVTPSAATTTLAPGDVEGGGAVLTSLASGTGVAYEGGVMAFGNGTTGEFVKVPAAGRLWFETRVKVSQIASPACLFFGLGQIGGTALNTSILQSGELKYSGVGFKTPITPSAILETITQNSTAESGNSEINTGAKTLVADTYAKLGITTDTYVNAASTTVTRVRFWVDGVLFATHTTKIPTTELAPQIAVLNGPTPVNTVMTMSWMTLAIEDLAPGGV